MKLNIGIILNQARNEYFGLLPKIRVRETKTTFRDFLSLVNLLKLSSFVLFCEKNML